MGNTVQVRVRTILSCWDFKQWIPLLSWGAWQHEGKGGKEAASCWYTGSVHLHQICGWCEIRRSSWPVKQHSFSPRALANLRPGWTENPWSSTRRSSKFCTWGKMIPCVSPAAAGKYLGVLMNARLKMGQQWTLTSNKENCETLRSHGQKIVWTYGCPLLSASEAMTGIICPILCSPQFKRSVKKLNRVQQRAMKIIMHRLLQIVRKFRLQRSWRLRQTKPRLMIYCCYLPCSIWEVVLKGLQGSLPTNFSLMLWSCDVICSWCRWPGP